MYYYLNFIYCNINNNYFKQVLKYMTITRVARVLTGLESVILAVELYGPEINKFSFVNPYARNENQTRIASLVMK